MGGQHPDGELHPVATGKAAEIVAQHQKEQDIKLYSGWFCPWAKPHSFRFFRIADTLSLLQIRSAGMDRV